MRIVEPSAARPGASPAWRAPAVVAGGVLAVGVFVAVVLSLTHGGEGALGVPAALLRFVRYVGSLMAVGGFVFLTAVRAPSSPEQGADRRVVALAAAAAAVASIALVPVQAALVSGQPAGAFDWSVVTTVLSAGFGQSVGVGVVGLALLGLAVARTSTAGARTPAASAPSADRAPPTGAASSAARAGIGAAGCLLALGAFLLTGHTVVSQPQAVALTANLTHTTAGAVWLGGLVLLPLALSERRRADDLRGGGELVGRFSTAATVSVLAAGAGGLALAWVEVRSLAALATPYGTVLLVKIALVAAVASLGGYNNRRLVPAIRRGDLTQWQRLTRIMRWEAAGLVAVLAVTAVLVDIVPARVEAGVDAQVVRVAPLGAGRTATVIVEPAHPGTNEVHVYVDGGGIDEDLTDVTLGFVPPGEQEPAQDVTPSQVGPGHWLHLGSEFTTSGDWILELVADPDDPEAATEMTIPIAAVDEWDHQ